MSMIITCPHCNLESEGEVSPGQTVQCPYCGEGFPVPAESEPGFRPSISASDGKADGDTPIVITPVRTDDTPASPPSTVEFSPHPHQNGTIRIQRGTISASRTAQEDAPHRRKRRPFAVVGIVAVLVAVGVGLWIGGVFGHTSKGSKDSPASLSPLTTTTTTTTTATTTTTTQRTPSTTKRSVSTTTTRPPRTFTGPRAYVKRYIDTNGNTCRVVSLTKLGGDVVVCNRNDWASSGCPQALNNALDSIVAEGGRITDVTVTESGRWLVISDRNAAQWFNIPYRMEQSIREYNHNNEEIYSATFNDVGDWIIITDKHYSSSAGFITDWLSEGEEKYGELRSACICGGDAVAVFDRGFLFWGNIPDDLKEALRTTLLDVRIIKIAGPAWFFADAFGSYQYNM